MLEELSKGYLEDGLRAVQQKKLNTAQHNFEKAALINENNWEAINCQGLCLYALGEFNKAEALWEKSISVNSREDNIARKYINSLKEDEFVCFCNLYNKALTYAKDGHYKKANKILNEGNLNKSKIVSFINFNGLCKLAIGKKKEAISLWQETLKINKENEAALKYIISSHEENNLFFYNMLSKILKKI